MSSSYHVVVQQLHNNLRPTRNLSIKFLINSRRIKDATDRYTLGLITLWDFLNICSHASAAYEQRQRIWALRVDNIDEQANDIDVEVDGAHAVLEPNIAANDQIQLEAPDDPQHQLNNIDVPQNLPDEPEHERNACVICMIRIITDSADHYIVLPCGHAWICGECVRQLERQDARCPVCRERVERYQRIFFS